MFSKTAIKRPITTIMVILMVAMGGILSYTNLDLALMPTMDIPIAIVSTTYVGAGPSEIETLITKPIEEAISSISNIDTVSSQSMANSSFVIAQFTDGTDIDMAAIDMREKIDLVKGSLPDDANDPLVLKMDINAVPIYIGVTSANLDLTQLNDLLDENVVNRLERIEGVSAVTLSGGDENEIEIKVSPEKLAGYGLTTNQITQVLKAENINLPSGSIYQGDSKMQIRTIGEFTSVDDIRHLPITTPQGGLITLSDVAEVNEVIKERSSFTIINGEKGILISLDKQSTANIVEVSDKIYKEMDKITKDYPELHLTMLTDTSDYIKTSISNVTSTAFQSAAIAVIVLFLFLRNLITSLIIGVSIPVSIFATFGLMYLNGMSMNIISMGGITIGIGMLVDNSVVVMDNIFKFWERGYSPKEAAELGAKEIAMAVTASTLTTVAVFLPLAFVKGTIGQLFQNLAYTICFALAASLVVSLTFVPMACSILLFKGEQKALRPDNMFNKILNKWGDAFDAIDNFYRKVLMSSLRHRKRTFVIVVAFFLLTMASAPLAGFDFMPSMDQGSASISIELPKGSKLELTEEITNEALYRISSIPELDTVFASVGSGMMGGGTDSSSITILLVDMKDRTRSTDEVCDEITEMLSDIPGADITVSASSSAMGSYGGKDVSFTVTGTDMETLRSIEKDLTQLLSKQKGLKEVTGSSDDTVPEATVKIDRARASQYGITTSSIAGALSTAVSGSTATQYKVDGDEIDVTIRYDKDVINYLNDVKNVTVTTASGTQIPLTEVANIYETDSTVTINRENQKKYVTVEANTDGIDSSAAMKIIDTALADYPFPDGYSYSYGGNMESMMESFTSLFIVLIVAILLIYMIMASQFENLVYPGIVMFSMPLAITGGIFGLVVTGNTITTTAFMGFIMLMGMVVNNAIVLIDYTNQLVGRGRTVNQALIMAGPSRLRPILMTTLTTIIGLLPMALGSMEGMEMQKPLAITVIFGLTISTIITLVLIPVIYSSVNDVKQFFKRRHKKKSQEEGSVSI